MENINTVLDSMLIKINELKAENHESEKKKSVLKELLSLMLENIEVSLKWEELKAENKGSGIVIENDLLNEASFFNEYAPINNIEVRQRLKVLKMELKAIQNK